MTTPGTTARTVKGVCRCEAHIAPAVLNGYACGNPECWRTAEVRASFAAFVEKLRAARGDTPAKEDATPPHG